MEIANATPNAAAPRPMASRAKRGYPDCLAIARRARQRGEQRPSWDEYGDASRTMPHRARRGGYRLNFSSSPKATARAVRVSFSLSLEIANADPEENGTTHSPRNPTPSLGLLTHSATASSTASHCVRRVARGLAAKGESPTVSSTIIWGLFAANPVVASASTLRVANRVTNSGVSPASC